MKGYEVYCLVDPLFFDSATARATESSSFEAARMPVPEGWKCHQLGWRTPLS